MSAVTSAITARPVCLKCGTIAKSGKISCCGHSGSWFGNCGGAGNDKFDHTWYEGIQACKSRVQFNRASGLQSIAAQRLHSVNGEGTGNSKAVMTTTTITSTIATTSIIIIINL